ncbi:hypothetical protein A5715_17875 [Mycolicibacter heraklionensis]|nr:hypothetical protein A5715_17875 [Mycolicibacter heraklionensis]
MTTADDIARVIEESAEPLTVDEIAVKLGAEASDCEALLWQSHERFIWQPGRKWAVAEPKSATARQGVSDAPDGRSGLVSPRDPQELRAFVLSSGLTISVSQRPLDTDAFFTVRSAGSTVALTLNSTHELFTSMPMPFSANKHTSYKELCEVLLGAWALYEDGLPEGAPRRSAQDARHLWGRRSIEFLRGREA